MHQLQDYTDEALFALLMSDNGDAFSALYNRYWDKLLGAAYIKLQSQEDAEEIVQQLFVDIWNNRGKTVLKYTFNTYISSALKYQVMARIFKRRKNVNQSIDELLLDTVPDNSTQEWLDFADLRDKIESTILLLPEKCQLVFRLSREQGLSIKQISAELDIAPKTVESHISKALKALKGAISQYMVLLMMF